VNTINFSGFSTYNVLLLLKIIKFKGNVLRLHDSGMTYSQIAMMISELEEMNKVNITEDDIVLTGEGEELLEKYLASVFPRKKNQWILRQEHFYKEPISADVIILPRGKV
jgi:hypothetical protein